MKYNTCGGFEVEFNPGESDMSEDKTTLQIDIGGGLVPGLDRGSLASLDGRKIEEVQAKMVDFGFASNEEVKAEFEDPRWDAIAEFDCMGGKEECWREVNRALKLEPEEDRNQIRTNAQILADTYSRKKLGTLAAYLQWNRDQLNDANEGLCRENEQLEGAVCKQVAEIRRLTEISKEVADCKQLIHRNAELEKYNQRNQSVASAALDALHRLGHIITPSSQGQEAIQADPHKEEVAELNNQIKELEIKLATSALTAPTLRRMQERALFGMAVQGRLQPGEVSLFLGFDYVEQANKWMTKQMGDYYQFLEQEKSAMLDWAKVRDESELNKDLTQKYFEAKEIPAIGHFSLTQEEADLIRSFRLARPDGKMKHKMLLTDEEKELIVEHRHEEDERRG